MRKTGALIKLVSIPLTLATLFACSSPNGATPPMVDENGKHADNWLQQHWVSYKQANGGSKTVSSGTGCSECHGSDLSGGISKVSCFTATFKGLNCHANDDHTLGHPTAWSDPTNTGFHGAVARGKTDLASKASCGLCHATETNNLLVGSAPSCLTTDTKWNMGCHTSSPAANPSGCVSCHAAPPDGANGAPFPSRAGAHSTHLALANVTCNTCHAGAGTGTATHTNGQGNAYLRLANEHKASIGTFGYVDGTCSAVNCHGGQATPAWSTGAINVNADCLKCHEQGTAAQTPQANSFYSGNSMGANEHAAHLAKTAPGTSRLIFCTDCHDVTKLAASQHFAGLATPAFEWAPGDTISGSNTRVDSYVKSTTTCTTACHTQAPTTAQWNR